MRDKNEGTYRGGEGTTPVPRLVQKIAEGKTSYKVKVIKRKKEKKYFVRTNCCSEQRQQTQHYQPLWDPGLALQLYCCTVVLQTRDQNYARCGLVNREVRARRCRR